MLVLVAPCVWFCVVISLDMTLYISLFPASD